MITTPTYPDPLLYRNVSSVENKILAIFTAGEAWHNFHHTFPWDYKTSELPFYTFNVSTAFIDFFAWLGWATELKTVPQELIESRALRTGDGSRPVTMKKSVKIADKVTVYGEDEDSDISEDSGNFDDDAGSEIHPTVINGKVASWGWGDPETESDAMTITKLVRRENRVRY